jgi:2-amino-4-hydroxy-6-hydroxymethyldihydropteridine diphosphokinase/dihydropteroate synthase
MITRRKENHLNSSVVASCLRVARTAWQEMGGESSIGTDAVRRVTPLGHDDSPRSWDESASIMGVLNATPDSFSDGGELFSGDSAAAARDAVARAKKMVAEGAAFIDVGGQSTRPGASRVSASEESKRVVPVIRALVSALNGAACVSVDTFYGSVAAAAASAGADAINDVSGGTLCPEMFRAVAETRRPIPYVCMHMRGDPTTMQSRELTTYAENDVPGVVGRELGERFAAATAAGIEPWRVWSDPGIGFAKTYEGNWDVLSHLDAVRSSLRRSGAGAFARAPMLVGVSRKGFLGQVTGRENAADRDRATAAACAAAVVAGANVVRVHDVGAVVDAVRVAEAVRAAMKRRVMSKRV